MSKEQRLVLFIYLAVVTALLFTIFMMVVNIQTEMKVGKCIITGMI